APQSIRKLTLVPVTWKQVLNLPPEPSASPQPTNRNCIGCSPPLDGLSPARGAEQPRQQPDRDHDDSTEQEVAPQPVNGVKTEIPQPAEQGLDAVQDIRG